MFSGIRPESKHLLKSSTNPEHVEPGGISNINPSIHRGANTGGTPVARCMGILPMQMSKLQSPSIHRGALEFGHLGGSHLECAGLTALCWPAALTQAPTADASKN